MTQITPRLSVSGPDSDGICELIVRDCGDTFDGDDSVCLSRAEADALIAALNPWRDIASAPKDGTSIWLWWDGKRRLAHWHEAQNPPSISGRFANWLPDDKGSVSAIVKPLLWHPVPVDPLSAPPSSDPTTGAL